MPDMKLELKALRIKLQKCREEPWPEYISGLSTDARLTYERYIESMIDHLEKELDAAPES